MGIKSKLTMAILTKIGVPRIQKLLEHQRSVSQLPNVIHPTENAPTRFEIQLEMLKLMKERNDIEMQSSFPIRRMLSIMKNINLSVDSIAENPIGPAANASIDFLNTLREFAQVHGVGPLEFVKLPRDLIFQYMGVIYDNAIILAMEMSQEKIDMAPSQETMNMVFETYDTLGIAANKIAKFLRENGFGAQADHPLGGLVLFPPLAQRAGIGWVGKHGLLITPEFGPRVRLAAVYTSIQNLSFADSNEHDWIDDYCTNCRICIEQCPAQAILKEVIVHDTGRISRVDQNSCFEYFAQFYGCSVCIKVCPFSQGGDTYEQLKAATEKTH